MLARFRCGNKTAAKYYWMGEEEKKCKICGISPENLEHLKESTEMKFEERYLDTLLDDVGRGKE